MSKPAKTTTGRVYIVPEAEAAARHKRTLAAQAATNRRLHTATVTKPYDGAELRPFTGRPGSMDAFALPSRTGPTLRYRDGTTATIPQRPQP